MNFDKTEEHQVCDPCLDFFGACAPWEWAKSLHVVTRDAGSSFLGKRKTLLANPDDQEAAKEVRLSAAMFLAQIAEALHSMPVVSGGSDAD